MVVRGASLFTAGSIWWWWLAGVFLAPKDIFWPARIFYYTCPLTYVYESIFYEFYQGETAQSRCAFK